MFALAIVLAAATAGAAQELPPSPMTPLGPPQLQQPPEARKTDIQRRRKHVQILEGVLARAVRSGAEELARQMQRGNPNVVMFTGQARARGFLLDGYGVFFDVEIPALRESVVWSMLTVERDLAMASAIEQLRRALAQMPQGSDRVQAEQALQRMQAANPAPPLAAPQQMAERGTAVSATVAPAIAPTIDDPHAAYTESVQHALIDAMLDFSLPIDLQDDEYLTVAARDSEGPLRPDEIYDASTIVIRVKGSDLAMYAADKSKRDEVRKRVVVKVF